MFASTSVLPGTLEQPLRHPSTGQPSVSVEGASGSEPIVPFKRPANQLDVHQDDPYQIELGEPVQFPPASTQALTAQKPVDAEPAGVPVATPDFKSVAGPAQPHVTAPAKVHVQDVSATSPDAWNVPIYSGTGRPIEVLQAGLGTCRILILGSIYGNEPESIELMDAILRESAAFAQSPSYSFVLMRTPNPDGLMEHIRTNHNGVDLNRNFPSTWFTTKPNRLTGPHPASEIETQNLMRLLKGFRPHRVVHVRSSIGQRPLVLVNDHLDHAVEEIRKSGQIDAGAFRGEYKAGSIEEFTTLRVDAELMVIHLPPKGFLQMSARQLFQLATMNFPSEQKTPPAETLANERSIDHDAVLPPDFTRQPPPQPDGEKGFVELLPPPPNNNRFNQASRSSLPEDPKFYELPPPPGK